MLKSEQILHSKTREKRVFLPEAYGVLPFKLKDIDETEMGFVLSQIDSILMKDQIKKLFHRESAYRALDNQA